MTSVGYALSLVFAVASFALLACGNATPRAPAAAPAAVADDAPPASPGAPTSDLSARAQSLAQKVLIADGHIDLPYRLLDLQPEEGGESLEIPVDLSQHSNQGDFDIPRARAGGLDAPFMAIYVPAEMQGTGKARAYADHLIDFVEAIVARWPDDLALARSPAEVAKNRAAGKISFPLGMENGAPIEEDLASLAHFFERGIRYIGLAHSKDNQLCDSSYDERRTWKGLSPFGEKVIVEMNRLGIMVDVSHVSDDAFYRIAEISKAPLLASHSSARHFTPGFERNLSDRMIEIIAASGGVVLVNFGSSFVTAGGNQYFDAEWEALRTHREKTHALRGSPEQEAYREQWRQEHPPQYADVTDVADHIDHIVKLTSIDHVGFGSDFEGVGDSLPTGLKDVSMYANLVRVLLERGYSETDIAKVAGGNFMRVWGEVLAYATRARTAEAATAPPS